MEYSTQQQALFDFCKKSNRSVQLSARAGTGKTTTLMELLQYLEGATWFCAFNKSIVAEIEFKVNAKIAAGKLEEGTVKVSTVHSMGMQRWRKHIEPKRCDVDGRKLWKRIDALTNPAPHDKEGRSKKPDEFYVKNGNLIRKMADLAKSSGFGVLGRIQSYDRWYELIEHFGMDFESGMPSNNSQHWDPLIDAAIKMYKWSLDECLKGNIDFSDMLLAPMFHKSKLPRYDNILIDEDQDISPLRLELILGCLKPGGRIIGVGDPYQAIYGFTGADDQAIETIKDKTSAKEFPLTITYRCPKAVVAFVKQWVPDIEAHPDAPDGIHIQVDLKDGQQDSKNTQVQALTFWDCAPYTADDVVLCRNTKPLVALAYEFLRKRLPVMVEGRDIGQGLINLAQRWKSCRNLNDLEVKLTEWSQAEIAKLKAMKQDYKAEAVSDQYETLIVLMNATRDTGGDTVDALAQFINRLFGDTPDGQRPKCITFSTVHKSKGREWDRVFLLGRNRYMPSKFARQDWEKQQEVNLQYVAGTRTKKELIEVNVPLK